MFAISVIVCTHNPREDYLRRVLRALSEQTLAREHWEFLLVDNATPDPVAGRFDLSWHPHARSIVEPQLGVAHARLRAIQESTAALLVFVDDDAVLAPDYLERALEIQNEYPFLGSWGGSCVPEYETEAPSWIVETALYRLTVLDVKRDVWSNLHTFETTPVGAGLCCRREVAERYVQRALLDPDRVKLDRKGTGLAGFGDIDLAHCALDLGLGLGLFVRLSLTHLVRASRLTVDYITRHAEEDAASYQMFCAVRGYPVKEPKELTWLDHLVWFGHRVRNRVPREVFSWQKAGQRGTKRGYAAAQQYLLEKSNIRTGN